MHAEDASTIDTKFNQIFENEKTIHKNLWQQIANNNDIIINFNNIYKLFYKEQEKIEEYINNFKNSISKELVVEDKRVRTLQILKQILIQILKILNKQQYRRFAEPYKRYSRKYIIGQIQYNSKLYLTN